MMRKIGCLVMALTSVLFARGSVPTGSEAVDCEVKTVPYVNDTSFTTWGNQQTTNPDAEAVCLFKNLKLTDIVGFSATSYRAFGGYAFQSYAIDTLFTAKPEQASRDNYDWDGFYFFSVAEDGLSATMQVQAKVHNSYSGQLLLVEFVKFTQQGDDIWGCVRGMKYCYNAGDYGDDLTTAGNSNTCKYYYDTDAMNSGHAVANFSLQDLKAYTMPAGVKRNVTFVGKDGTTIAVVETDFGAAATAPDAPEVDGYVFYAWDKDFSNVTEDMTVTALYHKWCTVSFTDATGAVIGAVVVEETKGVPEESVPTPSEPEDGVFDRWNVDFSNVSDDLVVEAVYASAAKVTFKDADDTTISVVKVKVGEDVAWPDMTGRTSDGQPFVAWSARTKAVTESMTVTALYGSLPPMAYVVDIQIPDAAEEVTLENVHLFVELTVDKVQDLALAAFTDAGRDVWATDAEGHACAVECVSFDPSKGGTYWVSVPSVTTGDTLKFYYGSSAGLPAREVWSGYAGVWHLDEASGAGADSTGHGLVAVPNGNGAANMIGVTESVFGQSRRMRTSGGGDSVLWVSKDFRNQLTDPACFTVEGWFNCTEDSGYQRLFSTKSGHGNPGFEAELNNNSTVGGHACANNGSWVGFTTPDLKNAWQKLTFVSDGASLIVYTNGARNASNAVTPPSDTGLPFAIGNNGALTERSFCGMVDEVRMYNGALSEEAIAADYKAQQWSRALTYSSARPVDQSKPLLGNVSLSLADITNVTVTAEVLNIGAGATDVDLYVAYGPVGGELGAPFRVGTGTTTVTGAFALPEAGLRYQIAVYLMNNRGYGCEMVSAGAVHTIPETHLDGDGLSVPGLRQGKLNLANNFTEDFLANSVVDVEITPGALMADSTGSAVNPNTGTTHSWNGSNTTFGYAGYIWLTAGDKLNFAKNVDDSLYIVIDGTEVIKDTSYNNYPVKSYTATESKWHALEVRVGDGSGGKGPSGGAIKPLGLGWNLNGATVQDSTGWYQFADGVEGLKLRVGYPTSGLALGPVDKQDGVITVWASTCDLPASASLRAYYGDEDMGKTTEGWEGYVELATVPAGDTEVTQYSINGIGDKAVIRLALVLAPGSAQSLAQFTSPLNLSDVAPAGTIALGDPVPGSVDVSLSISTLGLGASSATVALELSETADFASYETTDLGRITSPVTRSQTLEGLGDGVTYYLRARMTNSRGMTSVSEVVTFESYNSAQAHPGDVLVWNGGAAGTWGATTKNWLLRDIYPTAWTDGCVAKFVTSAEVTVDGAKEVVSLVVADNAAAVTLTGSEIDFSGAESVRFEASSVVRFNGDVGGANGFVQTAADGVEAKTEWAGNYAAVGKLAVNAGTIEVVGTGTLFGGNLTASGSRCENPICLGAGCTFTFNSSAAQTIATLLNATNEGSSYSTIKKSVTTGRFVIGPQARNVIFSCSSEGLHRFYNGVDVYGTVTLKDGTYHLFNENAYGITVCDGGVLNLGDGYYEHGHRGQILTCLTGGIVNYNKVQAMGAADSRATFDGGTAKFAVDYTSSNSDTAQANISLKNGALFTGEMMTWGWNRNTCTLTIEGSSPSAIELKKIRFGQSGTEAASNKKMIENLVVNDVTGDADADLTVSSELYKHATATCAGGNEPYFGIVKKGAGTVLFTGASPDYGASLTLEAGTVAFGSSAALGASALIVTGDAAIEVEKRSRVTFGDSSAMTWAADKTLTFSGTMGRKSVRVGTNASALTAAQLKQIQFKTASGKLLEMTIDENGYLLPPETGLFIQIR